MQSVYIRGAVTIVKLVRFDNKMSEQHSHYEIAGN